MRKKTTKMLREYATGIGTSFEDLKSWWEKLPAPEKAVMSERIQKEMRRAKRKAEKEAKAAQQQRGMIS